MIYKLVRNNSVSCLPQGRKYCIWLWVVCPLQVHWGHGLISKETPTTMTTSSLKKWQQKWRNRTWGWNRCRLYSAMEPERPYISSQMSRRSVFLAYAICYIVNYVWVFSGISFLQQVFRAAVSIKKVNPREVETGSVRNLLNFYWQKKKKKLNNILCVNILLHLSI